jgi:1-acyl-sn-glycerol-3-phosphate acyltransferase
MGSNTLRLWRGCVYLVWTLAMMPVQALGLLFGSSWATRFPCFYHRQSCRILGIRVQQIGHPVGSRPVLFAANHTGYLDIAVLGSRIPGSFISKSEVARWPLFGWLAKLQRCVFVDRQARNAVQHRDAIAERLAAKDALILFPEGTSGDGNFVLPFKSALFSTVFNRDSDMPIAVQPVSVAYTRLDGLPIGRPLRPFFAWYGDMTLPRHLWHVLGLGIIEAVVEFHPPAAVSDFASRKELAQFCYERISVGVGRHLAGRDDEPDTSAGPWRAPEPTETPASAAVG